MVGRSCGESTGVALSSPLLICCPASVILFNDDMEELQESPDSLQIKTKRAFADLIKSEAAVRGTDLIAGAVAIGVIFWWLQFSTSAICCGDPLSADHDEGATVRDNLLSYGCVPAV